MAAPAVAKRSWLIPSPTVTPISPDGDDLTAQKIVDLHKSGLAQKPESRARIMRARDFRRKTLRVQISPTWAATYPDIAAWVTATSTMSERTTLEQDQLSRTGAVEPEYLREPIGKLERDKTNARKLKAYMNEWRRTNVPVQTFFGKGIEDGEYGRLTIPATEDIDGIPDFYERLDEDAFKALNSEQRRSYKQDSVDRKGRYAKYDDKGNKLPGETWQRDGKGRSRFQVGKGETFDLSHSKSKEAHDEAVRTYLLQRRASNTRVIPALDCAPFFVRGKGAERWDLACLVERSLFYPEELIGQQIGWEGMGDRLLVPHGYESMRMSGNHSQFYLYTAYLVCSEYDKAQQRMIDHPIIAYCVGGYGTWSATSDTVNDVAVIDLYAKYGLEGALWSYHWGLHNNDDEPDFYGIPYLDSVIEPIMGIEGNTMSIRAATALNSFTGYNYVPDSKLAEVAPEAFIEADGTTLKRPEIPALGKVTSSGGTYQPFAAARVGEDAWRLQQSEMANLIRNVSSGQVQTGSDPSGTALVAGSNLALTAQRHTREGALNATVMAGQDHLRIVDAIFRTYGVSWPQQTVEELPEDVDADPARDVLEYDPDWVGDGHFELKAAYPPEENLARRDMAMNAAERGFGSFDDVAREAGEKDSFNLRVKIMKDQWYKDPANQMLIKNLIAKELGNIPMQKILQLQADSRQTKAAIPGFPQGVPTGVLAGPAPATPPGMPGPNPGGGSGPSVGAMSRGGEMAAANQQANTLSAMPPSVVGG